MVTTTKDKYHDLVLCAISSVLPSSVGQFEMMLQPNAITNLRVPSVLKIDRIVTLKKEDVIAQLGELSDPEIEVFKEKFKQLVS